MVSHWNTLDEQVGGVSLFIPSIFSLAYMFRYFPYLRFLKADYTMDWKTFQRYFCDPESEQCRLRIRTILTCIQHRRTMGTTVLGRPIITLPTPHPKLEYVNFSPAEKIIYRITENRFRSNLNRFFAKGDAARNYSVFMVQLLRLRQITSHPWQIERTMRECWTFEDLMELKQRLKDLEKQTISPFYEQTKVWLRRTADEQQPANGNGEDHRRVMPFGKGDFGRTFSIDHALASLNEREMMERVICGICADFPDSAVKTQVRVLDLIVYTTNSISVNIYSATVAWSQRCIPNSQPS